MTRTAKTIAAAVLAAGFLAALLALREGDPQAVVHRAQSRLASETFLRVETVASLLGAPKGVGADAFVDATGVDITMSTDFDREDPLKPASVSRFEFVQRLAGGRARLAGEARRKDGVHYLRLDAAEGVGGDAEKLVGAWAKTDRPLVERLFPPAQADLAARPLDAAGFQAMRQALGAVDVFKVDKKLSPEKIDGQLSYHYLIETDMQAVSALLLKLRELRSPAPLSSSDVLSLTAEIVRWGKPVGEIWIGKRDGRVLRLMLQTHVAADGGEGIGAIARFGFSRYGQPVAVSAPEARDIDGLLGPDYAKRLGLSGNRPLSWASTETATGAPVSGVLSHETQDSDDDGLSDAQEAFYGSDASSPDTDGDGWSDGLEVSKGMNPIGPGVLFGFGL